MTRAIGAALLMVLGMAAGATLALLAVPPDLETDIHRPAVKVELVRVLDLTVYGLADKNTTNHPQHFQCKPTKGGK